MADPDGDAPSDWDQSHFHVVWGWESVYMLENPGSATAEFVKEIQTVSANDNGVENVASVHFTQNAKGT